MKFQSYAYIFLMPGFSEDEHATVMEKNGKKFKCVGIEMSQKEKVLEVAQQIYHEGYQMIELCGGFGPEWVHKISETLQYKIPVGNVYYGPEYRKSLVDLLLTK